MTEVKKIGQTAGSAGELGEGKEHGARTQSVRRVESEFPSPGWNLIVDDRERYIDLFEVIKARENVTVTHKRLETGDYAIYYGSVLIAIIERKTWDDLAASVTKADGELEPRIDSQMRAMHALAQQGVRTFLIIEGRKLKLHHRIPSGHLETKLDHLMYRYRIPVIYTASTGDTVARVMALIDNCPDDIIVGRGTSATAEVKIKRAEPTQLEIAIECVCQIPEVSISTATALLEHYTPRQLVAGVSADDVAEIKYGAARSRIGAARAAKITNNARESLARVLGGISGVSENLAAQIAALPRLDMSSISDLKRGGGKAAKSRRVGEAIASKIITMLDYTSRKPVEEAKPP